MVTRFGAYEILHELKRGGMGAVLLGRRRGPGAFEQLVALKTIRPEYADAPAVRAMFLDEAAILARINHPGIAAVHDFGEDAGTLYMAMEYVAGISFRALADLALPPAVAARAIAEACRGVHAAHEVRDTAGAIMGVVHRDISPDNLMLGFDGHVKVIDFGIALVRNRQAPVTEFGTVKGKPPYMSPEQVKNEAIDRRSDVFSLAVVLHEILTGQPLFDGASIYAVARAVEHMAIRPPSQVAGRPLPLGLDAAVMNALDRDLARRTPTAAALAETLEQVINTAGDETLEAWAERELAAPRGAHRTWLATITAGATPAAPVIGRATGAVTQVNPHQLAAINAPVAAPPAPPHHEAAASLPLLPPPLTSGPAVSTHLAASTDDDLASPPRRSLVLPLVLAVVVVLAIGGGVMVLRRERGAPPAPDARAPDATSADAVSIMVPVVVPVADDAAPEPAPADAAVPIARPDARPRSPRDARVATVPHDAASIREPPRPADAAVAEVAGVGRITVPIRDGTYFNLLIDGVSVVTPHIDKPIAAGSHTIVFLDPKDGHELYRTTVQVRDGAKLVVRLP